MKQEKDNKPVSLFELFYDLVFVYAIANLTNMLEYAQNGEIPLNRGIVYLIIAVQVLETWLYQTNYNNRFGSGKWYEVVLMSLNMMAVLLLSNVMGGESLRLMRISFLISAIALLSVGIPYFIVARQNQSGATEARSYARMILIFMSCYLLALALTIMPLPVEVFYQINTILVIAMAAVPAFVRRDFDTSIVDFPHLTERFELLTIITFGEMVTSVASYYRLKHFDHISIGAFLVILLLFGSYVVHNHHLIDRSTDTRGLVLMYSHFGIILGINLMTVGQTLILHSQENTRLVGLLMISGILLFYLCMYANGVYYGRPVWNKAQLGGNLALLAAGAFIMALIPDGRVYLVSMLTVSGVEFGMLLGKNKALTAQATELFQ